MESKNFFIMPEDTSIVSKQYNIWMITYIFFYRRNNAAVDLFVLCPCFE